MMPIPEPPGDMSLPWYQRLAGYRHGIPADNTIPQALADAWTEVMIEAVRAFHEEDYEMQPALDYIDDLEDEKVEKRIAGYQKGYDAEYDRRAMHGAWSDMEPDAEGGQEKLRYVFTDLPAETKRALVSNWDRVHHEWLAENPLVHYTPYFGYFWLIEGFVIKMYEEVDTGEQPTEESVIGWEAMGAPGGVYAWAIGIVARSAGPLTNEYTNYPTEFED